MELTSQPPGEIIASNYKAAAAFEKFNMEYELDMHMHVHLENNILFPAAMILERELV